MAGLDRPPYAIARMTPHPSPEIGSRFEPLPPAREATLEAILAVKLAFEWADRSRRDHAEAMDRFDEWLKTQSRPREHQHEHEREHER